MGRRRAAAVPVRTWPCAWALRDGTRQEGDRGAGEARARNRDRATRRPDQRNPGRANGRWDVAIVRPNERLPADGFVITGTSAINQAPVTGESIPVDKVPVADAAEIGRAHVCTPVTNAPLVSRLL